MGSRDVKTAFFGLPQACASKPGAVHHSTTLNQTGDLLFTSANVQDVTNLPPAAGRL